MFERELEEIEFFFLFFLGGGGNLIWGTFVRPAMDGDRSCHFFLKEHTRFK